MTAGRENLLVGLVSLGLAGLVAAAVGHLAGEVWSDLAAVLAAGVTP